MAATLEEILTGLLVADNVVIQQVRKSHMLPIKAIPLHEKYSLDL